MRISTTQQSQICQTIHQLLGKEVTIRVFGSRLHDNARGGDLDLLIQTHHALEQPALLSSRIAARVSRLLHGRKVDVLLQAPNLKTTPVHYIAQQQGQLIHA